MYRLLIFMFALFLLSCAGNDESGMPDSGDTTLVDVDSLEIQEDSVLTAEAFYFFDSTGYSAHAQDQLKNFSRNNFKLVSTWKEDSLLVFPFAPDTGYYEKYGSLLRYSPDSSYFIDLDSYQIDIRRDKSGRLKIDELGPDTEISLIDLKNKTKSRLVYVGPSASFEDGVWLDNETILLAGYSEINSDSLNAYIYKIHIPTNRFSVYEFSDSGNARKLMGEWRMKRLKMLEPELKK